MAYGHNTRTAPAAKARETRAPRAARVPFFRRRVKQKVAFYLWFE